MKSFSVLTVSARTGWEDIANASIAVQTVQPKAWYLVSRLMESFNACKAIPIQEPEKTKVSNLNAALNAGLNFIDTEYVIFYQDFISLDSDCFEKLLALVDENTFVTTCTPNYDNSDDSRYLGVDVPRECRPEEWEANVAIAPMKAIYELGGFDEDYDNGWSWDNVNLAERAALLGYKFIIDESNRPTLFPHPRLETNMELNLDRHTETMRKIKTGEKDIKLPYVRPLNYSAS